MRKHKLVSDNIYHVFNRGIEKRIIFNNSADHARFVKGLVVFNDNKPTDDFNDRFKKISNKTHKRMQFVDIIAFCLMPNHYHLLLKQRNDNGITEFMRKLGDGYVKYFNLKYQREGTLFQSKFKSVLIEDYSQFLYVPHYIHLNPLDLSFPEWRDKRVSNKKLALKFLNNYEWSSYLDYLGNTNFSLVLNKELLNEYFIDGGSYKDDISAFLDDISLDIFPNLTSDVG